MTIADWCLLGAVLLYLLTVAPVNLRCAYVLAYVGNRPTLRTILWNLAFVVNVAIFILPAVGDYAWLPRLF